MGLGWNDLPDSKETLLFGDTVDGHYAICTVDQRMVAVAESECISRSEILHEMLDDRCPKLDSCVLTFRICRIEAVDSEWVVEVRVSSLSAKDEGRSSDENDTTETDNAAKRLT